MNLEDVMTLANKAGISSDTTCPDSPSWDDMVAFANLVQMQERTACANILRRLSDTEPHTAYRYQKAAEKIMAQK